MLQMGAAAYWKTKPSTMVAIAIFSADPALRHRLEQLPREDPAVTLVGIVDHASALLRLIDHNHIDVIVADAPSREQLADWRVRYSQIATVVLLDGADEEDSFEVLNAGARAVLRRSANPNKIIPAIKAVTSGLVVLQREVLATLLDEAPRSNGPLKVDDARRARLTRRELEVLAAMADGASNKVIARRLGISFHTVKFHVAAILSKLNADSRTEAVTKAAQLGLVML
jgi:two-component system, NarL family, response regulator YdfI